MDFGIDIPTGKEFDAVALGLNAIDHLIVVPRYPAFNTKIQYLTHHIAPGGQSATAMVALARLGCRTRYIGKVGSDENGRLQIHSLESEGVHASDVQIVEGAQSQDAFIIIEQESGERTIIWNRDERLTITPSEVACEAVASGRVLHLDGHDVEAAISAAQFAQDAGIPTVLDIDNLYSGTERLLPLITFLISSSTFPERMTGEADRRVALQRLAEQYGCPFIAATLGDEGVLAYIQNQYLHIPAFPMVCQDTTGAGDAFHGGFTYGLLAGYSVEETLRFANAVAGLKCRALGARTALPTLIEVTALLERDR